MYKFIFFLLFGHYLLALDVNNEISYNEILSHSAIYIDKNKSETIQTIKDKKFLKNTEQIRGFGYSPNYYVWIRFTLTNNSTQAIEKILEYDNPLTSHVVFYEASKNALLLEDGLLHTPKERISIHPSIKIILYAQQSKTFYIKAHSEITTLIVKLKLWNSDTFHKKEIHYQFILALFFGAMGIIIIYNFIIYLSTRQNSYLYYVLSFVGITIYYLLYKGIANLYILPPEDMIKVIEFSSFIVAMPVFFLALFTRNILDLKQYPQIHKVLNYYLLAFLPLTLFVYIFELNTYRSIFVVLLLFMLVGITFYALIKNNRQARFLIVGWLVFFTSGLFMLLSSQGIYDIFTNYPYYTELSLIAEAIAFSLSLADKIKQTQQEKLSIQNDFIAYQKEETTRLSHMVKEKTNALSKSLDEKKLLLRELNHRVKNSMQTIISFLRLQKNQTENSETQAILQNLENKVFAINDLYSLLHTTENISTVNAYNYFSLLIDNVRKSFQKPQVSIELITDIHINSDDAVYCGFILNEAITNAYQHAFNQGNNGQIIVSLKRENNVYSFTISDNGVGYTKRPTTDTLGMIIIDTLAKLQLDGTIEIDSTNGVKINITWKANG